MRFLVLSIICSIFWQPTVWAGSSLQQKALDHQMKRKLSFDQYTRDLQERKRIRFEEADSHKKKRSQYVRKKEQARTGFRRSKKAFPVKEWRHFLSQREQKKAKHKVLRKEFSRIKKVLDRVKKTKEYRIDKNREYQL